MKADVGLEVAFAEAGGWDTHANQGGIGRASWRGGSTISAAGIAALTRDLGDRMADVVILTMSEFGRAVAENGNRGTDHGHGNAMMIIGGQHVRGGRVYGRWPGLLVSLSLLPGWVAPLSWVLAPTWGINALREAAIAGNPWPEIGMCLLLSAVYLVIGHYALRHFERLARERATLAIA